MKKNLSLLVIAASLIIACKKNNTTNQPTPASNTIVSTISGSFNFPQGIAIDATGNLYVGCYNAIVAKITPAGVVSTFAGSGKSGNVNGIGTAASFFSPSGLAIDAAGNLYLADDGIELIRKITPTGVVSTFAGSGISGSANGISTVASFNDPHGIVVDAAGNVYVTELVNQLIRKITPAGVVSTFAGSGIAGNVNGTGTAASFNQPYGLALDAIGNVFVADALNNIIRKITPAGVVSTFAGSGIAGNANGTSITASFYLPQGLVFDSAGNLYVADSGNNLIRKITPAGVVSTFAGSGTVGTTNGISTTASFDTPQGLVFDAAGNLYVLDSGNGLVRKIVVQ
jgi:secreted PhoX family phosphatase